MPKLRLAFMGTSMFAVTALHALRDAGHDIVAVYTPSAKPAGRGYKIRKSPIQTAAEILGIEVRTPQNFRDIKDQQAFADLNLDAAVVAIYSLILPPPILRAPKFGCINIHPSLLPRWRGVSPVKSAILAGDTETGVTIMQLDDGIDTGPMLLRESILLSPAATAETLDAELAQVGARLIVRAVEDFAAGKIKAVPQPPDGVTYAAKLTREDGRVDWKKPAIEIEWQVRALQPWPGCFFMLGEEPVKILSAAAVAGTAAPPGTLLDALGTVACGSGALRLMTVQRPGKTATDAASFLRGLRLPPGHRF